MNQNLGNDDDSIDFDFFDMEDNINFYESGKHNNSSKIITKAIIESTHIESKEIHSQLRESKMSADSNKSKFIGSYDFDPGDLSYKRDSSVDNIVPQNSYDLDNSLFNCLAYSNSLPLTESTDFSYEDNDHSSNSSSDSAVTNITSELTSISPISSLSNSTTDSTSIELSSSSVSNFENNTQNNSGCDEGLKTNGEKEDEDSFFHNDSECSKSSGKSSTGIKEYNHDSSPPTIESDDQTDDMFNAEVQETSNSDEGDIDEIENSYSETWESGSESNDRRYENIEEERSELSNQGGNSEMWSFEDKIENISLEETQTNSSLSHSGKTLTCRKQEKLKKRKGLNLTFSREQLIKIERENLILLRKIMAHSKPRTVLPNQSFCHKKSSTAINRAKQQKQIDQDNYVLYSKISAMNRGKKVF